jgi:integrase/recombinase XerD
VPGLSLPAMSVLPLPDHPAVTDPARPSGSGSGLAVAGSDVLAAALLADTLAEHPVLARHGRREQLLVAAWLAGQPAPRTRAAYAGDLAGWLAWLHEHRVDVLAVTRLHVDLYVRAQLAAGGASSSVNRRLSALSSFYRHAAAHGLIPGNPTVGVRRPKVDPDHTATVGLDRDQARALLAAADADPGPARLRTAAVIRLLLHNALRVDELARTDVADLGHDRGHRVLRLTRKGGRRAAAPLAPATAAAVDGYLAHRAAELNIPLSQLAGPLLATRTGRRLEQAALWHLVRRLARTTGIPSWAQLSPHSLRHTAITLALDAGASLRDVQDYAGHADTRTTRRYDHSRDSLDRSPTYTLAAYLA